MSEPVFKLKKKDSGHTHPEQDRVLAKVSKKKQSRLNVTLDEDTYLAFKLASMKQGKTVTQSIKEHIAKVLKENE